MRTITIKGIGRASVKPNYVMILMDIETIDLDYERVMEKSSSKLSQIKDNLGKLGFDKEDIKTTNFDVQTYYRSEKDENDNYKQVFKGFKCEHSLKLEFDFDNILLSETMVALAKCKGNPEFRIKFTVKDPTAVSNELLQGAAINARKKAEVLCSVSGVKLGQIHSIDYDWCDINFISRTDYTFSNKCLKISEPSIDFTPDDIDVSDTVTFVWEIL